MGFRFRKRVGLFGGLVHLNLSRRGVSVSAGPNDANVNFDLSGRRKHPRATLGGWAAKVLLRVGFFSLLMVIAIAVGRLL